MARIVNYVGYVPANLKDELIFIDVLMKTGIITTDQRNKMLKKLEDEGHMDHDKEIYQTGDDYYFSIRGEDLIDKFKKNMKKYLPKATYKIADHPIVPSEDKKDGE